MAAEKEEISAEHVNPVFVKLCNKGKINLEKRENSVKMHRKLNRSPSKCVYTLPDQHNNKKHVLFIACKTHVLHAIKSG